MEINEIQGMSQEARTRYYQVLQARQNLESLLVEYHLFEYMSDDDILYLEDSIFDLKYYADNRKP